MITIAKKKDKTHEQDDNVNRIEIVAIEVKYKYIMHARQDDDTYNDLNKVHACYNLGWYTFINVIQICQRIRLETQNIRSTTNCKSSSW